MSSTVPALVIVDMQEDFCPPTGSLAIPSGRDIAPRLNELLSRPFALKVTTQDWHPSDSKTFASAHASDSLRPFESFYTATNPSDPNHTETWRLWPDHCVRNTPGAALIPELDVSQVNVSVLKGLDAEAEVFSGFGDIFGRNGPSVVNIDLAKVLKEKGVTDVYVGGLAAEYCVKSTALDAAKEGFKTFVLWDCTKSSSAEGGEQAKDELRKAGVQVIDSDAVRV